MYIFKINKIVYEVNSATEITQERGDSWDL